MLRRKDKFKISKYLPKEADTWLRLKNHEDKDECWTDVDQIQQYYNQRPLEETSRLVQHGDEKVLSSPYGELQELHVMGEQGS